MQIIVNGQKDDIAASISLAEFLLQKNIKLEAVVVEHNGSICKTADFADISLQENDRLEVITLVGGG